MAILLARRIRTGSIYRLVALGTALGAIPLCTLFGVLAAFDLMTLNWNGQAVTGPRGLIIGPLIGVMFVLIGTAFFGSAMALGLWLYSKVRPIELEYEQLSETASAT